MWTRIQRHMVPAEITHPEHNTAIDSGPRTTFAEIARIIKVAILPNDGPKQEEHGGDHSSSCFTTITVCGAEGVERHKF